jgi:hypothetical protein
LNELEIAVRFAFYYFLEDFEEVGGYVDGTPGVICYWRGFVRIICRGFWLRITAPGNRRWNSAIPEWKRKQSGIRLE